ncbi:MAG: hypothetical protein ACLGIJ_07030 [Candidatus Limnocylindria bacterium]
MLDRLIAGAGAVADAADRAARAVARAVGITAADARPGSVAIAAMLGVLAGVLLLVAAEGSATTGLRTLGAGDIPDDDALGTRVHATVSGALLSTYVETYTDIDGDGVQGPGETGEAWAYWMVDPVTRRGLTVLSLGEPSEVLQATYSGILVRDPGYVAESAEQFEEELDWVGATLDADHYVDARAGPPGVPLDLGDALPRPGVSVTVTGARTAGYLVSCSANPDGDGACEDHEVDMFDVVMFEPDGAALLVLTADDPELLPVAYTGIVRRDASAVTEAMNAPGFRLEDYDVHVSPTYVLDVGASPTSPGPAYALAIVAVGIAAVLLVGLAGGYVGFRSTGRRPAGATTLGIDDAVPVRLTGVVRTPRGPLHVRDVPARIRRFAIGEPATGIQPGRDGAVGPAHPSDDRIASTIIVERVDRPEGVALGLGELRRLSVGVATTFRGERPAVRATAGTGPLVLSFDDAAARDRAAAELVDEAGLDLAVPPDRDDR